MRNLIRISALLAVFAAAPAFAAGTPEQQEACEGDARTYCETAIPDEIAVEKCLRANMKRISPACRAQFGGGGKGGKRR
jgi:hypothetical protein